MHLMPLLDGGIAGNHAHRRRCNPFPNGRILPPCLI
jgi:hypothetical protein